MPESEHDFGRGVDEDAIWESSNPKTPSAVDHWYALGKLRYVS